jgi:hypothetical protein
MNYGAKVMTRPPKAISDRLAINKKGTLSSQLVGNK